MTVTSPNATMKSAKKRARQEAEEDETRIAASTTPSRATKRQNMSKTPVRMQTTPKMPPKSSGDSLLTPPSTQAKHHGGVPAITDILPPRTAALYLNQNNNNNSYNEEKANNLLEPPAPPPVTPTRGGPRELPTSPDKRGAESLIIRETNTTEEHLKVSQVVTVDEEGSSHYAGIGILILVILLVLVSGLWSFERMSSQITIGALQLDLHNCRALHSQDRKQDEYYVKELETEMRVWRQEAKAKYVELEALRTECQLSKESTDM